MKFDWSEFTEEDFVDYCAKMENGLLPTEDRLEMTGDYIGCVRAGELAFDLMLYPSDAIQDMLMLWIDCYAGGIGGDNAYGYSRIEEDYPYEYVGRESFEDSLTGIWMDYESFKALVNAKIAHFIYTFDPSPDAIDLPALAEMPLHVW